MQYMLLLYGAENAEPAHGTPEFDAMMQGFMNFTNEASEAGKMLSGDALEPVTTATTVRVRGGKTETTDGPFAETKEVLGGYYLFECDNLDEAIKQAARIPTAKFGSIEVRPVMVYN